MRALAGVASWWAFVLRTGARYEARELWRTLPGPWYVKVAIIVITQLIPGQIDDYLFLAGLALFRRTRAWWRAGAHLPGGRNFPGR